MYRIRKHEMAVGLDTGHDSCDNRPRKDWREYIFAERATKWKGEVGEANVGISCESLNALCGSIP